MNVVEKQPEAHHVYVLAPAALVPMAVHFVPSRKFGHASAQLQPWMPTIRAALEQLRETDDVTWWTSPNPASTSLSASEVVR